MILKDSKYKNLKLLIISYDYFPEETPNSYRWGNIAKYWSKNGIEVFVLSAVKNQYKEYQIIDGVKVFRSKEVFIDKLKYKFNNKINLGHSKKVSSISLKFKKIIRKIYDLTWSKSPFKM